MVGITATGVGSGVDVQGVVSKLVAAEGDARTKQLDSEQASALTKISAYGTLSSALSSLQDTLSILDSPATNIFNSRAVTGGMNTAGTSFFSATANHTAIPGSYGINVQFLATAQQSSSTVFGSSNTVVGTGDLNFTVNGNTYTVSIDSTNNTVAGIAQAVNSKTLASGVSASVIQTDLGAVLVFSSTKTGTNAAFTVAVTNDSDANNTDNSGLSQLASNHLSTTQAAQNSVIQINGLTVTNQTNVITGAIGGVTINLMADTVGSVYNLTIDNDKKSAADAINSFVKAYNNLIDTVSQLGKYQPLAKTADQDNSGNGVLLGDATLLNVQVITRKIISSYTPNVTSIRSLADLGITTDDKTGRLMVDQTVLNNALSNHFGAVNTLFSDPIKGVAANLDASITGIIGSQGILQARTDGLTDTLADVTQQRAELSRRLDGLQTRLLAQFSAMDRIVAQLNNTSAFLEQQVKGFVEPLAFRK